VRFQAGATTGGLSVPGPRDAWLAGIDNLAWIPGTRSLWATGGFDADAGEAILKYGP
jgi:hypothetical protein